MINYPIELNVRPTPYPAIKNLHFTENDTGNELVVVLQDRDGFKLQEGMSSTITYERSDGKTFLTNSSIDLENNSVVGLIPKEAVNITGKGFISIQLYKDAKRITSLLLEYNVVRELAPDNEIEDSDEYIILIELINDVESIKADLDRFVIEDNIREENESIRIQNEIERQASESYREGNEASRIGNEDIRISQELDRVSNEGNRKENELSRIASEINRRDNETLRVDSEIVRKNDENSRKLSESDRVSLYNTVLQKLNDGEFVGEKGSTGDGLEYIWDGTSLGVKTESQSNYSYVDLKGQKGDIGPVGEKGEVGTGLNIIGSFDTVGELPNTAEVGDGYLVFDDLYVWDGSKFNNVGQIRGPKGEQGDVGPIGPKGEQGDVGPIGPKGEPGSDANVTESNIELALGFIPKNYVAGDNIIIDGNIISSTGGGGPSVKIGNVLNLSIDVLSNNRIKIAWGDPNDVILEGITLATWAGTQLRRKLNTYPIDENDGELVVDNKVRDTYIDGYIDTGLVSGEKYYYTLFPYTDGNAYTIDSANRVSGVAVDKFPQDAPSKPTISDLAFDRVTVVGGDVVSLNKVDWYSSPHTFTNLTEKTEYTVYAKLNETETHLESPVSLGSTFTTPSDSFLFGVKLDTTDSNPETCLTYIEDSVGFAPVNGTTKNLGSWSNFIDEFLSEYVTVDLSTKEETQIIDKNDFTKLKSGGNSVLDGSMGDLMWKIPKLYWKFETIGTDVNIYLSDSKIDDDFVCLAHTKGNTERDYIYYGVSLGVEISGKLRSLGSGVPTANKTIGDFRTLCEANGTDAHMLPYYPWLLYQIILVILGKNLDTQTQWGNNHSSNTQNVNTNIAKGLIFGNVSQGSGVNAFINDPWGNQRQWLDGFKYDSGGQIKVATENFNDNATGYEVAGTYTEQSWGYIKETQLTIKAGFSPKSTSGGSSSTYFCDEGRSESSSAPFPSVGGRASLGDGAGAFGWHGDSASYSYSALSARIFMYGS